MKKYYKIGEISKLYSISPDSLRYYEDLGILKPKRDVNGYRMYSINDIWTLNILRELRTIGFSMEQIKEHLLSYDLKSTLGLFSRCYRCHRQKNRRAFSSQGAAFRADR